MARAAIFSFPAPDATGICALQTATTLTINGTDAVQTSPGWPYATLSGFQRCVTVSSASNLSGVDVTIQGYTWSGLAVSETLNGPSGASVSTTAQFMTVTSVFGAATLTGVEIGWGNLGQSRPFRPNPYNTPGTVGVTVNLTGTITYTVRTTYDDVETVAIPTWSGVTGMSGATAAFQTNLASVPRGVQVIVTGATGAATLNFIVNPTGI